MGGTVAETIRKEDGQIIKMARKTGAYNWMFFSKDFNSGKIEEAIDAHVQKFTEMKDDFESGEPYKFPMSPVYGWCDHIAPTDYGLVVIDFQNKKIHSMQGYDVPGTLYSISLSKHMGGDKETKEAYKFMAENNLFEVYDNDMKHLGDIHSVFGAKDTFNAIQKEIENAYNPLNALKDIFKKNKVNPSQLIFTPKALKDFEIITYEEGPEDLLKFLTNLKADGFNFNADEVKMWKEHFADFQEYGIPGVSDEQIEDLSDEEYENLASDYHKKFLEKIDSIVAGKISSTNSVKP